MNQPAVSIHRNDPAGVADFLDHQLPPGAFTRILLKPNWVKHADHPEFPIEALVTSSTLIEQVIEACLRRYKGIERILVGDVPLQSCEWETLIRQAGIDRLIEKYAGHRNPTIQFLDLRRERWRSRNGFLERDPEHPGDPAGYVEVNLDEVSLLEPVSELADRFRVSDYDPGITTSMHARGRHRYLIARSVLESDLIINLPKMKTHQKAGITGALKNLVGINGSKAHLVHHRLGTPSVGGDEFPESASRLVVWQVRLRELLQKRSRALFRVLRVPWTLLKRLRGVETVGTRENLDSNFYVGAGSWHGNDSIWRMVYDLNLIVLMAAPDGGRLDDRPRREYIAIADGWVAGEGNGPLQPLPVDARVLLASANPFILDLAMARLMGFDPARIASLSHLSRFPYRPWAAVSEEQAEVWINGERADFGLSGLPPIRRFVPAPGWRAHIESSASPASDVDGESKSPAPAGAESRSGTNPGSEPVS